MTAGGLAIASLIVAMTATVVLAASTDFFEPTWSPEAVGDGPISIAAADLDGDRDADLAVANHHSDDVTILLNTGIGNFVRAASSPERAGAGPISVAAADLDRDGDRDLAVASRWDNVTILRNSGTGNFVEPSSSPEIAGREPLSVAASDLDGDADRDLAIANFGSKDVTILRNNGTGDFTEPGSSPETAGSGPAAVVAADLDGDRDRDLAVANDLTNDVTILRNNGFGNFAETAASPLAVKFNPLSLAAADLDGDGDSDLAVANYSSHNLTVLRNRGTAQFREPASSPVATGLYPRAVAAADLDRDGDRDLAVANEGSYDVTVLRNNGSGGFIEPASSPESTGVFPVSVAPADLDRDGDSDLSVANSWTDDVTILKNR